MLAQEAKKSPTAELRAAVDLLNGTYPRQMVDATDPNYEQSLLAKIAAADSAEAQLKEELAGELVLISVCVDQQFLGLVSVFVNLSVQV